MHCQQGHVHPSENLYFFQPVPTASNMILRKCWKFFRSTNRYCPCFPTFQHNFLNREVIYFIFIFIFIFYIPLYRRWKRKNVGNSPLTLLVKANFSNILPTFYISCWKCSHVCFRLSSTALSRSRSSFYCFFTATYSTSGSRTSIVQAASWFITFNT